MCLYNIIQFGVGGTGGHLVHFLAPFIHTQNKVMEYIIVDGDKVEEKNISRQNFTIQHVDQYKAEILGLKYNVLYSTQYVTKNNIKRFFHKNSINIVIGCIDTVKCRLMIDTFIKNNIDKYDVVYFDAGNMDTTAQVIIYDYINSIGEDITEFFKDKEHLDHTVSCSELGDQTILANMMAATHLMTSVCSYIKNNKIQHYHYIITKYLVQTV